MSDHILPVDIWRLQSQADVRGLLQAIKHPESDIRKRAVAAVRALGATSAIPALQAALVAENDSDVRAILIATLDHLFIQDIEEDETGDTAEQQHIHLVALIAQLHSSEPEKIIQAARELGELREKIAAETLIMVFHNRELSSRVRLAAAEALIKLESAPVEVTLLAALRHVDWRVRRNAAAVLGQLKADWAVEPLRVALTDEHDLTRRTAQAALERIATPEAFAALQPPAPKVIPPWKAVTRPLGAPPPLVEKPPATSAPLDFVVSGDAVPELSQQTPPNDVGPAHISALSAEPLTNEEDTQPSSPFQDHPDNVY